MLKSSLQLIKHGILTRRAWWFTATARTRARSRARSRARANARARAQERDWPLVCRRGSGSALRRRQTRPHPNLPRRGTASAGPGTGPGPGGIYLGASVVVGANGYYLRRPCLYAFSLCFLFCPFGPMIEADGSI
mgnify:CR=1 FL=1